MTRSRRSPRGDDPTGTDALTYAPEGGSLSPDLLAAPPAGYRARRDTARIGTGDVDFQRAADAVRRWEIQERVGIRVVPDGRGDPSGEPRAARRPHPLLQAGDDMVLHIRAYGVTTRAPIRVVRVLEDRPDRAGFAYGTRRGHPESGEVAFLVERRPDDAVWLVVRSFSRPANRLWALLWPFVQWESRRTTARYLQVLAGGTGPGLGTMAR